MNLSIYSLSMSFFSTCKHVSQAIVSRWRWPHCWSDNTSWVWARSMRACSPSAIIAKLLSTFTRHRTATIIPLHPILALRTLLELSSLHKLDKIFITLIESIINSILSTSHPRVILALAPETIMFFTSRTSVII